MARELTREEKRAIRALVTKWCANYDREYGCLPLDCECYMLGKCWTGAYCRYFREAVLPLDPALEVSLLSEGPRPDFKICPVCGGAVPADGRMAYCSESCARIALRRQKRDYMRKSGGDVWKIRLWKTRLYQGFPGPFWGWTVSFYGLPLFCSNAFHIYPRRFWTLCPEVAGHLRRCYSGRKSRLCDPPHDPV